MNATDTPPPNTRAAREAESAAADRAAIESPAMALLTTVCWRLFWLIFGCGVVRILYFVRREGPPLPRGAVIVAPNHCSFLDPVVTQMACWRQLSQLMTEIYYRPLATRWFFVLTRTIPVKEGRGNRDALDVAARRLRQGWTICIYPEGAIAKDGRLQRFQPGVAALSETSGAPIVPCAVVGSFEAWPRHARFPRFFRRITVRFGAPIPPPSTDGEEGVRRDRLRAHTEEVRRAVLALLEPEQRPLDEPADADASSPKG